MRTLIHKTKNDEGYILLDVIIALLILTLTLTSVYSLLTKTFQFENRLEITMDELLDAGEEYDKTIKKYIK